MDGAFSCEKNYLIHILTGKGKTSGILSTLAPRDLAWTWTMDWRTLVTGPHLGPRSMTVAREVKPGHLRRGDGQQEEEGEDGGHGEGWGREGWCPGDTQGNHGTSLLSETIVLMKYVLKPITNIAITS